MSCAPEASLNPPTLSKTIVDKWDPEYRNFILSLPKESLIPPHQIGWSEDLLTWVRGEGAKKLNLDKNRIAVGGYSSGGALAAAVAQQTLLSDPPIKLVGQAMFMPSLNLTSSYDPETWSPSMREYAKVPGLWTRDVLWARDMHTPKKSDQANPIASPLVQTRDDAFKAMAPTWIGVAEMDTLRSDGETYAKMLKNQGVQVELKTYIGASHLTGVADGVCALARRMQSDQIAFLHEVFQGN
ncbi:hypothetical protein RSAG8_07228, partial [Rhizoctonia solani AG-8 WAC10335]